MLAKTPLKDLMIEWLQTKNPRTKYRWTDHRRCACAQFARHIKKYDDWISMHNYWEFRELDRAAMDCDRTFGGLLRKLNG